MSGNEQSEQTPQPEGWPTEFAVLLQTLPFFQGLDRAALQAVANQLEWFSLPAGATLFRQGDPPDSLFIVVSGSLSAHAELADGRQQMVGTISAGETVGEMALISGRPRSATVRAVRDTELFRFDKVDFDRLVAAYPRAMLHLARLTVRRLESANIGRGSQLQPRTFAIIPHGPETAVRPFAHALAAAFARMKSAELVTREQGGEQTSDWFDRVEAGRNFVVYEADADCTAWSRLCLRQADSVILVANAAHSPSVFPVLAELGRHGVGERRVDLVLLNESNAPPTGTAAWIKQQPVAMHHHVRDSSDIQRLARILAGRAIGLVLSGGGARGFAHLGVIRALREANVPIDLVGGTSMGAIVAAGLAAEWTNEEMYDRYRRCFVSTNPLSDYTLPIVALVSGRKVSHLLRGEFGAAQIEDLVLPFFCMTANLSSGRPTPHRAGLLWRWLRASVAIPGVLPPVFDQGEVHVDAGAINNLPVDVMRQISAGPVIAVDVGSDSAFTVSDEHLEMPPLWRLLLRRRTDGPKLPNIFQILWRAGTVNGGPLVQSARERADMLLQPPLETVDMLNWKAFDRAIDLGYRHASEKLAQVSAAGGAAGSVLVV